MTYRASGQAGGGFSFECSQHQGALLIMGDVAYRKDAVYKRRFSDYITEHHRSWLDFAEALGWDLSLSDLILVDGCDKTSEWACAAWSEKTESMRLSFVAGVPGVADANAGLWGRWVSSQSLDKNVGPQPLVPVISTTDTATPLPSSDAMLTDNSPPLATPSLLSSTPPPSNQCVFVRGFRMGNRSTFLNRKRTRIDVGTGLKIVPKSANSGKQTAKDSTTHDSKQQSLSPTSGGSSQSSGELQGDEHSGSDEPSTSIEQVSSLSLYPTIPVIVRC